MNESREKYLKALHDATITYCFESNYYFRIRFYSETLGWGITFYDNNDNQVDAKGYSGQGTDIGESLLHLSFEQLADDQFHFYELEARQKLAAKRYISIIGQYIKHGIPFDRVVLQQTILFAGE